MLKFKELRKENEKDLICMVSMAFGKVRPTQLGDKKDVLWPRI